ncbi:MAG: SDR family NAD(P)-dependent oxidoreductase, partial [Geminicoccaceae bacterium]
MFSLGDRKALVTGASGGIGGAIARQLHQQGAHVILSGRRREALESLQSELGERCSIAVVDLGEADGPAALIEAVEKDGLDILINNAGLTRDNLAMRMKDEDW